MPAPMCTSQLLHHVLGGEGKGLQERRSRFGNRHVTQTEEFDVRVFFLSEHEQTANAWVPLNYNCFLVANINLRPLRPMRAARPTLRD
jgi:hypothetical protein